MNNNIRKLYDRGQSIWCDNISRQMIESGELQRLIDLGVVGVTSNPTIFMKAISGASAYDALFTRLLAEGRDLMGLYEGLVLPDIAGAADLLRPVYERTGGADGYVSLEVDPRLAYDPDATVADARRLFTTLGRPNVLLKVPSTEEGLPAIETLIAEGINVNVTLIFGLEMYGRVMRAYLEGLLRRDAAGGDIARVASVASFFVSRIDTLTDKLLEEKRAAGGAVDDLTGQAATASARLAYARFEEFFDSSTDFAALAEKGAGVQRPLWASTSTKNPDYPDTLYVDGLVAPRTVNTLPPATIEAMLDHGRTRVAIRDHLDEARALPERLAKLGIKVDAVADRLLRDGVDLFIRSFEDLMANLEQKQEQFRAVR